MKLQQIIEILDAVVISDTAGIDIDIKGAYSSDLMSYVLFYAPSGCMLITCLTQLQVIRTAEISGIKAIVFVQNKMPDKEVIELAGIKKIPLLVTPLSKFAACGKLYQNGLHDTIKIDTK